MKILLDLKKTHKNNDSRYDFFNWKSCLPFMENRRGVLIHRPKAVVTINASRLFGSKLPYLAVTHWCGSSVNSENSFTFLDAPPNGKILCERCETLAVEAGLPSAESLVGKHVHIGKVKAVATCCHDATPSPATESK